MCGRISRTSPRDAIANEFGVTRFAEVDWEPRYNVAPSQIVETIISVDGEKRLGPMRWGFVSPTANEPKLAPINARAETLSTSPMFRDAFRRHRCLVVADGSYECARRAITPVLREPARPRSELERARQVGRTCRERSPNSVAARRLAGRRSAGWDRAR
jgi:putative SOS response-associated peptidase YedK